MCADLFACLGPAKVQLIRDASDNARLAKLWKEN